MENKIQGVLISIGATQQVSDKFSKRAFVIMIDAQTQYPNYIEFELQQDRCDMIDVYTVDQTIEVSYNHKGRQWVNPQGEVKTFNTLSCWKIQPIN